MLSKRIKALLFGNSSPSPMHEEQDELLSAEKGMIQGVRHLSSRVAKDIMVPRTDTSFISLDHPAKDIIKDVVACGHSRIPIYKGTIDNVIGILYVKDILISISEGNSVVLSEIIRKPFFVPDSKHLDSLLSEMKRKRVHIAVVVDEYGGVSGITCLEDIIEEIVGEIQDEFDNEQDAIIKIEDNVYLCDARATIEDINVNIHLNLPKDDFDTLGGFVFDLFGKIPVRYEVKQSHGADFIIQEINGHRIESIKIVRTLDTIDEKSVQNSL